MADFNPDQWLQQTAPQAPASQAFDPDKWLQDTDYWGDVQKNAVAGLKQWPQAAEAMGGQALKIGRAMMPGSLMQSGADVLGGKPIGETTVGEGAKALYNVGKGAVGGAWQGIKDTGSLAKAPFEMMGGTPIAQTEIGQKFRERPLSVPAGVAGTVLPAASAFKALRGAEAGVGAAEGAEAAGEAMSEAPQLNVALKYGDKVYKGQGTELHADMAGRVAQELGVPENDVFKNAEMGFTHGNDWVTRQEASALAGGTPGTAEHLSSQGIVVPGEEPAVSPSGKQTFYHVTLDENTPNIMKEGLVAGKPSPGSEEPNYPEHIFMTKDLDHAKTMAEQFDANAGEPIARILKIDLPTSHPVEVDPMDQYPSFRTDQPISPEHISTDLAEPKAGGAGTPPPNQPPPPAGPPPGAGAPPPPAGAPQPSGPKAFEDYLRQAYEQQVKPRVDDLQNYISRGVKSAMGKPGAVENLADYAQEKSQMMAVRAAGGSPLFATQGIRAGKTPIAINDELRGIGQYMLDNKIVQPELGNRVMLETQAALQKKAGTTLSGVRMMADDIHKPQAYGEQMLQAADSQLGAQYAQGMPGSGEYQTALNIVRSAKPTYQGMADAATQLNKLANKANRNFQPHTPYTDVANTISELNNEQIKGIVGGDVAGRYEQALREYGVNKKIQNMLGRKVGQELHRTGPGTLTRAAYQKFLDEIGYKGGARVLNRMAGNIKANPALASNLPELFKSFINEVEDILPGHEGEGMAHGGIVGEMDAYLTPRYGGAA